MQPRKYPENFTAEMKALSRLEAEKRSQRLRRQIEAAGGLEKYKEKLRRENEPENLPK